MAGDEVDVGNHGAQTFPLPPEVMDLLRHHLLHVIGDHEGTNDPENTEDDARVIVEALPQGIPGAILSITCSARYDPCSDGDLTFRSITFDLAEELICSAAETYRARDASSDTSSRVIFECRPDGFSEGNIYLWIDLAGSLSPSVNSVRAELPAMVEDAGGSSSEGGHDDDAEDRWDGGSDLDSRKLSIEAQRQCGLLPTALERAKEDADHVSEVIQTALQNVVYERRRLRTLIDQFVIVTILALFVAVGTYLLGRREAWVFPALMATLSGLATGYYAAMKEGLDLAILRYEERLRGYGVSVDWEGRGGEFKTVVRWKAFELRLQFAAITNADPDFTRQK